MDWFRRLRTGSPTCVRASQCRPAGRERVPLMSSSGAPSASPLSCSPDCELGHDPVECHLGCAGLADRGVPTRTRHHNDGNRGRFDSRRRKTPVSMRARARPIGTRRLFSGAQAQIRSRSSALSSILALTLKNGLSNNHAGFRHGETRTRTGDTTIFSRYLQAGRRREIPGNRAVSAKQVQQSDVRNLRSFPGDSGVDGHLRPKTAARPDRYDGQAATRVARP